jgi:predicted phage-related endonuclease
MKGKIVSNLIEELPGYGIIEKHEDRAAWLAARKGKMTASKASALFGINEYLSRYRLWALESGLLEDDVLDNGNMRRGRRLEPIILEELAEARGWDVQPWPQTWTISHPEGKHSGRLMATPDGIARVRNPLEWEPFEGGDLVNVQVKTVNEWAFRSWDRDADGSIVMPIIHQIQTQVETCCLGLNFGVLVLQPSMNLDDMIVLPYAVNYAFLRRLVTLAVEFWEQVEAGAEPEVDGSESTWNTLKKVYAEENGQAVILPMEADELFSRLEAAKADAKAAKDEVDLCKNKLIAMIGDATFAQTPGGCNLSYKGRTMKRIDSKALRAAYPAIAAECEKVSEFRVLLPCKSIPDALLADAMANKVLGETLGDDA